jgi:hypothetical protein
MRGTHPSNHGNAMRRIPTRLILAAALAACGPCLAQQAQPRHAGDAATATRADAGALEAPPQRSAFGKVMAVMIESLRHQAREREHPTPPVRTSAAGTPLGIEVGGAFRTTLRNAGVAAPLQATGTGGVAAGDGSGAAAPKPRATAMADPG